MSWVTSFVECDECRVKCGAPRLCESCVERRLCFSKYNVCAPPKVCTPEQQKQAQEFDRQHHRFETQIMDGVRIYAETLRVCELWNRGEITPQEFQAKLWDVSGATKVMAVAGISLERDPLYRVRT